MALSIEYIFGTIQTMSALVLTEMIIIKICQLASKIHYMIIEEKEEKEYVLWKTEKLIL